jgi:hypothetical protein
MFLCVTDPVQADPCASSRGINQVRPAGIALGRTVLPMATISRAAGHGGCMPSARTRVPVAVRPDETPNTGECCEYECASCWAQERWEPYTLTAVGILGGLFGQSAFNAGPLSLSLPVIDTVEPVSSVILGAAVFDEHLARSPGLLALQLVGGAIAAAGIAVLSQYPVTLAEERAGSPDQLVRRSARLLNRLGHPFQTLHVIEVEMIATAGLDSFGQAPKMLERQRLGTIRTNDSPWRDK